MPKRSERQDLIQDVVDALELAIMDHEDSEDSSSEIELDSPVQELSDLLIVVAGSRFLSPRTHIEKSDDFVSNCFWKQPPLRFRQLTRTSRAGFDFIRRQIESHAVFANVSKHPQAPIWVQLAVALDRLGNYGNGASLGRTMNMWGIGKGTCDLYTSRIIKALTDCAAEFVVWPDRKERARISRRMTKLGFGGCVGFIDGTTIPLAQKPGLDGECYFDRKHRYSLNAQVVCDDRRRIICFYCGCPGSCGDSMVYKEMDIAKPALKRRFFDENQFPIADSAYPTDKKANTIVPSYKKNTKGNDIEAFNTCIAHVRVVSEHTIGVLKGRWASLRELRVQINKEGDLSRALAWIVACVVLHNMLMHVGDDWSDADQFDDESSDEEATEDGDDDYANHGDEGGDEDAYSFRRTVKAKAITLGRQPGGILWYRGI